MTAPKYAPEGYHYVSVSTPSVFREYLLPVDEEDFRQRDEYHYAELHDLAEEHGAPIHISPYERG